MRILLISAVLVFLTVEPVLAIAPGSQLEFSITIPQLQISSLNISHPDELSDEGLLKPLLKGVGHLLSYPGSNGTVFVYGHSSGYPWDPSLYKESFRNLNKLESGDRIYVKFGGKVYVYEVSKKQSVPAQDVRKLIGQEQGGLILYTCWPPDRISERYLVYAELKNVVYLSADSS